MEITRTNFRDKFGLVESSINEATFLAIDCEFTGLNEEWNLRAYDTPEERYEKIKDGAMQFLVIQFGICAFKYDEKTDKYTHKAFNFYIFPRSFGRHSPDPRFYSQSSSLEFLASQGFDFNKLLKEGIPYLTSKDEILLREKLSSKHAEQEETFSPEASIKTTTNESKDSIIKKVPKEHVKFIKSIFSKIENYLKNWKEGSTITLPACTSYQRKLIYDSVRPAFNKEEVNLLLETVDGENGDKFIKVERQSIEEAKSKLVEKHEKEMEELDEALGFTKVIRAISESKKLVVGHNMLLDLMHLVHQFCTPLPETYEEFKSLGHDLFPNLLDTKVMSSTSPFKDHFTSTALNAVFKRTREKPYYGVSVEAEDNFDGCYKTTTEQLHEAGYDAFITGLCYLSFAYNLGCFQGINKKPKHISPDNPLVIAFTNKLFMMRSPDIPYLNLAGPDLQPDRSHVFYVTFPKEWKTSDIIDLFSPCGFCFVSWVDQVSAFVSLRNPAQAGCAKSLLTSDGYIGDVKVLTYKEYASKKLKRQHDSDISETKKRKCTDEESTSSEVQKKTVDLGEVVARIDTEDSETPKKLKKIFIEDETWS